MAHLELTLTVFYTVFFVMLIFTAGYWVINKNRVSILERKSIFSDIRFWIPCLVYTILLGFRWDYAYDWEQYYYTFIYIQQGDLYRETTEIGYLAINYLLGQLGFNFYSIFLLEGFIYILSIYIMLQKNRRALLFALPLMYIDARYNCLNISRQFFAQSILWIAFYYLVHGKKIVYFILGALACSIHTSAYIWVVCFYFVRYIKIPSLKTTSIIYFLCVALQATIQKYFFALSTIITAYLITNKSYDESHMMADRFFGQEFSLNRLVITVLLHYTFILSAYFVIKRNLIRTEWERILILVGLMGVSMNVLGGVHEILNRFFWYFSYLYIIAWGICLYYMYKHFREVPAYIWLLTIVSFAQRLWSMYAQIVEECTGPAQHFIEYKEWSLF